jgi:SAM-dependent methyltransferase
MGKLPKSPRQRNALLESLRVLALTPREWAACVKCPGLMVVERHMWYHYFFRFLPLDIFFQAKLLDRPFGDFRFGDTPYATGLQILDWADVKSSDHFLDLGCGRGKMVFAAAVAKGCRTTGLDLLPFYIHKARKIADKLPPKLQRPLFLQQDFLQAELQGITVVYIGAATLAEETRADLVLLSQTAPIGLRWITVGWEIQQEHLKLKSEQEFLFSWGLEVVRLYEVVSIVVEVLDPVEADDYQEFEDALRPLHFEDVGYS